MGLEFSRCFTNIKKFKTKRETRVDKILTGRLKSTEQSSGGTEKDIEDASQVFFPSDCQSRREVLQGA